MLGRCRFTFSYIIKTFVFFCKSVIQRRPYIQLISSLSYISFQSAFTRSYQSPVPSENESDWERRWSQVVPAWGDDEDPWAGSVTSLFTDAEAMSERQSGGDVTASAPTTGLFDKAVDELASGATASHTSNERLAQYIRPIWPYVLYTFARGMRIHIVWIYMYMIVCNYYLYTYYVDCWSNKRMVQLRRNLSKHRHK